MGGDLPATTNPFVEKWGYSREVVEKSFRFSPKNLGLLGVFAVAIPGFIYVTSKKDFVRNSACLC